MSSQSIPSSQLIKVSLYSMKAQLAYIKANSDVLTGYTIWSAGSFNTQYELSVTPNPNGSDQLLWAQAGKTRKIFHVHVSNVSNRGFNLVRPNLP